MGTFLTSYGDDAYDHEGYAAQVLDDGSLTSTYSEDTTPRMVGQVEAACGCGWTGTTRYTEPEGYAEVAEDPPWTTGNATTPDRSWKVCEPITGPGCAPWCGSWPSPTPPPPAPGLAACHRLSSGNCWIGHSPGWATPPRWPASSANLCRPPGWG
jgi:hypothetical protein